jgi:hypothetical protein
LTDISYQWYYETSKTIENEDGVIDSVFEPIPGATQSSYTLDGSITINNTSISLLNKQIYCKVTNNYNQAEQPIIEDSIRIEIVANSNN